MKILMLPSWFPPQGGYLFQEQAEMFAQLGHEVDIVYTEYTDSRNFSPADLFHGKKVWKEGKIIHYRSKYLKLPKLYKYNQIQYAKKLFKLADSYMKSGNKPDVIFTQSVLFGGFTGSLIKEKYGIPLIIQEHRGRFLANNNFAAELLSEWQIPYAKKAFETADEILLLTNEMTPKIQQIAPELKAEIQIIPNVIDTDFFSLKEKTSSDHFRFLSISRLDKYKGTNILIHAFASLVKTFPNITLEIVGDGEELYNLKLLSEKLGVSEKIVFSGTKNREGIKQSLQNCDCFVLATLFDNFPLVALEAISTGTPIISTKSGGLVDIINEKNGYLCEVNNSSSIADAMQKTIENFDKFNRQNIRENAFARYSKVTVGKKLNNILLKYA